MKAITLEIKLTDTEIELLRKGKNVDAGKFLILDDIPVQVRIKKQK